MRVTEGKECPKINYFTSMNTIIIGLSMLFTFTATEKTTVQGDEGTIMLNRGEKITFSPAKHYFITVIDKDNNVLMLEKKENSFLINELW